MVGELMVTGMLMGYEKMDIEDITCECIYIYTHIHNIVRNYILQLVLYKESDMWICLKIGYPKQLWQSMTTL